MSSAAAQRLATIDDMPATELCYKAINTLEALVSIMNEETTLLRAGRVREASTLTAEKTALAQDYTGLVRSIQRQTHRLLREAPNEVRMLRAGHERLAVQMAENLKVLATARNITDEVLTDVAQKIAERDQPKTYGSSGQLTEKGRQVARALVLNRTG
jgi:hypothetical protein